MWGGFAASAAYNAAWPVSTMAQPTTRLSPVEQSTVVYR
jgi:hypothetical protein